MPSLRLIAAIFFSWLKLLVLKVIVWKFTLLWPRRKRLKRVLLLKPDHLGDFLICLSSFQDLCDFYHKNGYEITILVSTFNKPLAEVCPLFDHVLGYNLLHKDFTWRRQYEMLSLLYQQRYSVVINPMYFPRVLQKAHEITLLCRAETTATVLSHDLVHAPMSPSQQYLWVDRWKKRYTCFLESQTPSVMEAERELASALCGAEFPPRLYQRGFGSLPTVALPPQYYVIVPGGTSRPPWPIKNLVKLICKLHQTDPDLVPVLTGGPNEGSLGTQIQELLPSDIQLHNYIARSTLLELSAIIKGARFVLANDTGPAHLAPLLDVNSIALFGPWIPDVFLPNPLYQKCQSIFHPMECQNCGWKCSHLQDGIPECVHQITVDEVFKAIRSIL